MSINFLIAIAILALILVLSGPCFKGVVWLLEVHEARLRRRHAVRRRARARGYLPVYDEQYEPVDRGDGSIVWRHRVSDPMVKR